MLKNRLGNHAHRQNEETIYDDSRVSFDSKETVIELNRVHIEAYPAHHLDAMRGLPGVSFILLG